MVKELAIDTRGLTKQFDRHIAVNDIDLQIAAGEICGLIGPNGAGKTTLLRMLAAAEEPTTGEIYINGSRLLRDRSNPILKQRIGFLPDDFPLYDDLTVWDYLDYFGRLYNLRQPRRRERIYAVLELVQLTNKRNSLISTLSRGMKQRLSLGRTIIHEPLLLLLDEPVSGLDPIARSHFREIIKALQEAGMTVVISSHVLSDLAELCTWVGIMEFGYLVESAPLQELYKRLSKQQIFIATLGNLDELISELKKLSVGRKLGNSGRISAGVRSFFRKPGRCSKIIAIARQRQHSANRIPLHSRRFRNHFPQNGTQTSIVKLSLTVVVPKKHEGGG